MELCKLMWPHAHALRGSHGSTRVREEIGSSRWPLLLTTALVLRTFVSLSRRENIHTPWKLHFVKAHEDLVPSSSSLGRAEKPFYLIRYGVQRTINYRDKQTPANYTFTRPLHGPLSGILLWTAGVWTSWKGIEGLPLRVHLSFFRFFYPIPSVRYITVRALRKHTSSPRRIGF